MFDKDNDNSINRIFNTSNTRSTRNANVKKTVRKKHSGQCLVPKTVNRTVHNLVPLNWMVCSTVFVLDQ